jgi:hypothetical protein
MFESVANYVFYLFVFVRVSPWLIPNSNLIFKKNFEIYPDALR